MENEECLIMNKELEEEYLLNKNNVLKMKSKQEIKFSYTFTTITVC